MMRMVPLNWMPTRSYHQMVNTARTPTRQLNIQRRSHGGPKARTLIYLQWLGGSNGSHADVAFNRPLLYKVGLLSKGELEITVLLIRGAKTGNHSLSEGTIILITSYLASTRTY